jgi:DNA-binding transcriptional MocR family regulator
LPGFAALTPHNVWRLETLAKTLTPGLRIAFVVAPGDGAARRLALALRATSLMPSPLCAAIANAWIGDGVAEKLLAGVRAETAARQALARAILPAARGEPEAIHLWLDLPARWPAERVRDAAQARGLSLVGAEAFAVAPDVPPGLRLSLGGTARRARLEEALRSLAALLAEEPAGRLVV